MFNCPPYLSKYPYTNMREVNLDWFLAQFKPIAVHLDNVDTSINDITSAVNRLHDDVAELMQQPENNPLSFDKCQELVSTSWSLINHHDNIIEAYRVYNTTVAGNAAGSYMLTTNKIIHLAPFPLSTIHAINVTSDRSHIVFSDTNPGDNGTKFYYRGIRLGSSAQLGAFYERVQLTATRKKVPVNPPFAMTEQRENLGYRVVQNAIGYYNSAHDPVNPQKYDYGQNWSYDEGGRGAQDIQHGILNNSLGWSRMECDTFVLMSVLGIPYDVSPYAVYKGVRSATYNQNAIVNLVGSAGWGLNWMNRTLVDPSNIMSNVASYNCSNVSSAIADTGEMLRDFWRRGWCFSDKEQIANGDIVIFRNPQSAYFDYISHIGIIAMESGNPVMYHVSTAEETDGYIINKVALDDFIARRGYGTENYYFVRPDYTLTPATDTYTPISPT